MIGNSSVPADKAMMVRVMVVPVIRQTADRQQAFGVGVAKSDKKPESGDSNNSAGKILTNLFRQISCQIAIERIALGGGRATLGH